MYEELQESRGRALRPVLLGTLLRLRRERRGQFVRTVEITRQCAKFHGRGHDHYRWNDVYYALTAMQESLALGSSRLYLEYRGDGAERGWRVG